MKYSGNIGFVVSTETSPGIWEEVALDRRYKGDVIRNVRRYENGSYGVVDDINITNQISVVADTFMKENTSRMRYAEFEGTRWCISSVDISYPRIVLTLGGEYNGV